MSGNDSEMPTEANSQRLRDRATSAFQQRREQAEAAADGVSRLRDRASTAFQQRRQQAESFREQLDARRESFAGELGIGGDMVEPIQFGDRDTDVGFVPTAEGRGELVADFANERPFVEPGDATVQADPREGTRTMTAPSARDEIGTRARQETAGTSEFITGDDLDVAVGAGGVESIQTAPDRRDDIADRVQQSVASQDEFTQPGDVGVDVTARGITDVGLTDTGARNRAAREFTAATPLDDVDPQTDLSGTEGGFGLTTTAQRRAAARGFEDTLDTFGQGELNPATDLRQTDDSFGLTRPLAREAAADEIDQQLPDVAVGPSDIELEEVDGGRFEASFSTEVSQ